MDKSLIRQFPFLFFPSVKWNHSWERQHEFVSRFSEINFERNFAFSPLGMIPYKPFQVLSKVLKRSNPALNKIVKFNHTTPKNLTILECLPANLWLRFDQVSAFHANNLLGRANVLEGNFILWAGYSNNVILNVLAKSKFSIIDLAARRQQDPHLPIEAKEAERNAVRKANLVIVDNMATYKDYRSDTESIFYLPQGVNRELFEPALSSVSHRNQIGYIGNFHDSIDYSFLEQLINRNSSRSFLMVGNILDSRANRIMSLPNVRWHPAVEKSQLWKLMSNMEFGLIPYEVNDYTAGIFPTKLFEYLAAGVAVVSTPLPEVLPFANGRNVFVMTRPESIDYARDMTGARELVENNSWENRFLSVCRLIELLTAGQDK